MTTTTRTPAAGVEFHAIPGHLVYVDSLAGLLPAKLLTVDASTGRVTVRLTADRGPYKRGEVCDWSTLHVVARASVHVSAGRYVIRGRTRVGVSELDCAPLGRHHSPDLVQVWHGSTRPLRVCGFHGNTYTPTEILAAIAARKNGTR